MAVTVGMLRKLEITKDFKLVAGEGGLDGTINNTEILDFEFDDDAKEFRKEQAFVGNSIVLTSFLYAKGKPEVIVDAIKELIRCDVKALAYKPVIFDELPEDAIELANRMDFPIFKFGGDEFFEEIIVNVSNMSFADRSAEERNIMIKSIINGRQEENPIADYISGGRFRYMAAFCVKAIGVENPEDSIRFSILSKHMKRRVFSGIYEDRIVLVMSSERDKPEDFEKDFAEVMESYGIPKEILAASSTGMSSITAEGSETAKILREAVWTEKISETENARFKRFDDLGIYKFIADKINDRATLDFAYKYLEPVLSDAEGNAELLKTGAEYVFSGGDVAVTADRLFCHKNTVRYRINKLQEKLNPKATEKEFFAELSVAVKIYCLSRL